MGYFVGKNHDFKPKNLIFSNFRGGAPGAPPGSAPDTNLILFRMADNIITRGIRGYDLTYKCTLIISKI